MDQIIIEKWLTLTLVDGVGIYSLHEINPPDYAIDAAYERLKDATLDELSRLSRWGRAVLSQEPEDNPSAQQLNDSMEGRT
jgi:hypothetical protein